MYRLKLLCVIAVSANTLINIKHNHNTNMIIIYEYNMCVSSKRGVILRKWLRDNHKLHLLTGELA